MGLALRKREVGLPASTDAELIARTRAGDESAYADLYRRHHKAARAAAWCLTHSSVDTKDVVGEAFTQILSVLRRGLGPEEAFRPYLLTCVRNACVARGVKPDDHHGPGGHGAHERDDGRRWAGLRVRL